MVIDKHTKQWCQEDYDISREDFFVENAYYTAERAWAMGGIRHGIFAFLIAVVSAVLTWGDGQINSILFAIGNMGILTVCFWFYGIRNYDANSLETGVGFYIILCAFLFFTRTRAPLFLQWIFAIATIALFVHLTFMIPRKFFVSSKNIKKKIREFEQEEEKRSEQSYERWKAEYNSYRYGLPESEQTGNDPVMAEARKLFEGYTENQNTLKTRYRQLAKKYHPDVGGDTKMFQCIAAVYEEYKEKLKNSN